MTDPKDRREEMVEALGKLAGYADVNQKVIELIRLHRQSGLSDDYIARP